MHIYRISSNVNTYWAFTYSHARMDKVADAMYEGRSVIDRWRPLPVKLVAGRESDIMSSPERYAKIAINDRARQVLEPLLQHAELLPFSYKKQRFWCIYVPTPVNCLDESATHFSGPHRNRNLIVRAAFVASRVPSVHIFRIPDCLSYFVDEEFKRAVDEAGLTGATFEFMWSSDGSVPPKQRRHADTRAEPPPARYRNPPGRPTKVDVVLQRLWEEVIDTAYADNIDQPRDKDNFALIEDAKMLGKAALKRPLSREELERLARSIAYGVTFSTLVTLEDEGIITRSQYCGLHEGLLMASPTPIE